MPRDERHTATIPYGTLGIIPLQSCSDLGKRLMIILLNGESRESTKTHQHLLLAATREIATFLMHRHLDLVLVKARV